MADDRNVDVAAEAMERPAGGVDTDMADSAGEMSQPGETRGLPGTASEHPTGLGRPPGGSQGMPSSGEVAQRAGGEPATSHRATGDGARAAAHGCDDCGIGFANRGAYEEHRRAQHAQEEMR